MSQIDYQQLASAMLAQLNNGNNGTSNRTKAVSSTPNWTYGHGPGGLFSAPGLSQALFSAMILPTRGLQSRLQAFPSRDVNPLHGIITGVTASSGSQPNGVCDAPKQAGLTKLCTHTFVFGRITEGTKVIDLDRIGKMTNRGEFADFNVYGNPWRDGEGVNMAFVPTMPGVGGTNNISNIARTEIAKAIFELGVSWTLDFAKLVYEGNPANNTAGGGYAEFYGLDSLINTGYRDAITGAACPAADSIVASFAGQNISTGGGASIVNVVTDTYRRLRNLAARSGLSPVRIAIAMSYSLFYELSKVWPCAYLTSGCVAPTGATQFVTSTEQIALRDRMRGNLEAYDGQFLLIDGQEVEVILDDAIEEDSIDGTTFQSSMYFVPMTVLGNRPVTYMEYFDYSQAEEAANMLAPRGSFFTSDGGRFFWTLRPPEMYCVQAAAKAEPRLILDTPYLAARITNIRYSPLNQVRSPFTDNAYHKDGGQTTYAGPSYYSPTA